MAREARTGLGFADRLVLLMAWIATCGLVYLLGFYVGKGTQEHRLGVEEQIVRLPVTSRPPPEGQRAKTENEFGFYEKLMGDHPSAAASAFVFVTIVSPAFMNADDGRTMEARECKQMFRRKDKLAGGDGPPPSTGGVRAQVQCAG